MHEHEALELSPLVDVDTVGGFENIGLGDHDYGDVSLVAREDFLYMYLLETGMVFKPTWSLILSLECLNV